MEYHQISDSVEKSCRLQDPANKMTKILRAWNLIKAIYRSPSKSSSLSTFVREFESSEDKYSPWTENKHNSVEKSYS